MLTLLQFYRWGNSSLRKDRKLLSHKLVSKRTRLWTQKISGILVKISKPLHGQFWLSCLIQSICFKSKSSHLSYYMNLGLGILPTINPIRLLTLFLAFLCGISQSTFSNCDDQNVNTYTCCQITNQFNIINYIITASLKSYVIHHWIVSFAWYFLKQSVDFFLAVVWCTLGF